MTLDETLAHTFGHRLRVRVCGLCLKQNQVLLVCHKGMGPEELWLPPGGGLSFGERSTEALAREMQEETGLEVEVGRFCFLYEIHNGPFHAIELFFEIRILGGDLGLGADPELAGGEQSLSDAAWIDFQTLNLWENEKKHAIFHQCHSADDVRAMQGFYFYSNLR